MALPVQVSLPTALALGVAVYGIYQVNLPSVTEVRAADMQNEDVAAAERAASWEAGGLVAALSLIAKDPTIFLFGGLITVGLAWKYRHANAVNPVSGKATGVMSGAQVATSQLAAQPQTAPASTPAPAAPQYAAVI